MDLPIDSEGNKILSIDEKIYNGELIKSIKYMDKDGKIYGKTLDKDGKKIDSSLLVSKDKNLFDENLKQILKAKEGDLNFISDYEVLEVVVILPHEHIEANLESSVFEVFIDENGKEKKIKLNNKQIEKKVIKEKEEEKIVKLNKAREKQIEKMRKKIETFAKRNGLEKDSHILKAFENGRSSIKLKLKKGELEKFISKNQDLIVGIELAAKATTLLSEARPSTNIDPYAINYEDKKGSGIGIYMSEETCPNVGYIPNYTRLSGSTDEHAELVSAIIRGVSPYSYIYCRVGSEDDAYILPTSNDLNGYNGNPSVYIENYSAAYYYTIYSNEPYSIYDRDLDNHIYDNDIAVFVAAGNISVVGDYVPFTAKALNAITVGNYNDSDNSIDSDSSYKNSEIGNEKPELSAPGENITAGGHTESGTSFSSPHAAGFAADLMSKYDWLKLYPHLLKALMLSGATNNISGVEDRVGVGGIDFYRSVYNASVKIWDGLNSDYSGWDSSDVSPNDGFLDYDVNLNANIPTRVAISWLNRGTYTRDHRTDAYPLGMDFDLYIFDPSGNLVGYSDDSYDPFEIFNFTPSTTGTYRVKVKRTFNRDTSSDIKLGLSINWQ